MSTSIRGQSLPLLLLGLALTAQAQGPASPTPVPKRFDPCLSTGLRKTVVFLGFRESTEDPKQPFTNELIGTGTLIAHAPLTYIVTARHVAESLVQRETAKRHAVAFLNNKSGVAACLDLSSMSHEHALTWIASEGADLATFPFARISDFDELAVPDSLFLTSDSLTELEDVFILSYQPGLSDLVRVVPIARRGMVSVINSDGSFYIDAFAFPGNSGSPAFTRPGPVGFAPDGIVLGGSGCRFIGIVGEYLPYSEVAFSKQTGRPRVVFEENTGLAKVWPVQALQLLFGDPLFRKQHERVLAMAREGAVTP
jgi:hypothetical protein